VVADMSVFIETSVRDVQFDLLFGGILAVVVILLFLRNARTTLISAVAIPTSVVATFAFIHFMHFTLNWLTLLALSISIGILVDDAIVVIENIYRHMEEGKPRREAASFATEEIGLAVIATTSTIVAVFVPVAFVKGMVGRIFYEFGLTVSVAVLISLFVSFTLTPMLSSRFIKIPERQWMVFRAIERILGRLDEAYRATLETALRHRVAVVLTAVLVLAGSLYLASLLKREFLPPFDRSEFNIGVELPTGKSLDATRRVADAVAAEVRRIPGVEQVFVTAGGGVEQKVNTARLYVKLVGVQGRQYRQLDIMEHVRRTLGRRRGVILSVEELPIFTASGVRTLPIQFNLRGGQSLSELAEVSHKVAAEMRKIRGLADVDISHRGATPERSTPVVRTRAAALGVPVASIAMTIRALMGGDKATQLREGGDLHDVRVRLQAEDRVRPEDLTRLKVRSSLGALVDLGNLVKVSRGTGPAQIERQSRQRQITIMASLQDKPMGEAVDEINAIAGRVVPAGITTDFTGMAEAMQESFGELSFALLLAVAMVYMILASLFNSFVHPFTIMLSLPLSLVGALGGLLLTGSSLSIFAMIGIIMLMGLVTKNAILLVDYTNTLRARGLPRREALLKAGPVRLRPIIMTTAAMVFGMLPVALGIGGGAEMRAPMAICVIGGLITSTLLTLLVVPVVYTLLDDLALRLSGRSAKESAAAGESVEADAA
jgi:HAE1 family hydrophobic/amphiphilic exporter-1